MDPAEGKERKAGPPAHPSAAPRRRRVTEPPARLLRSLVELCLRLVVSPWYCSPPGRPPGEARAQLPCREQSGGQTPLSLVAVPTADLWQRTRRRVKWEKGRPAGPPETVAGVLRGRSGATWCVCPFPALDCPGRGMRFLNPCREDLASGKDPGMGLSSRAGGEVSGELRLQRAWRGGKAEVLAASSATGPGTGRAGSKRKKASYIHWKHFLEAWHVLTTQH